jgi:hypothetical protein
MERSERFERTRWIIDGADAETGEDQTVTIEAADRKRAELQARQMGLLVSGVRPAPQPISPPLVRTPWTSHPLDNAQDLTLSSLAAVAPTVPPANGMNGSVGAVKLQAPSLAAARSEPAPIEGAAVDYATPPGRAPAGHLFDELPPEYRSLQVAGIVMLALAMICYVGGALMTWASIRSVMLQGGFSGPLSSIGWEVQQIAPNFLPIVIGGVLHLLSAGCGALRDLARNSFHRHGC